MVSGLINPGYAIAGFAVGALVGMTGVGGGSLMTPILVLFFGIDAPKRSAPTCCSLHSPKPSAPLFMVGAERSTGRSSGGWR
jgi:hypothetical protein